MKATTAVDRREVHIVGGGTLSHVRSHLSLAAPAYGTTARRLAELCQSFWTSVDVNVHLTKMADPSSNIVTNNDLRELARQLVLSYNTKIVIWNPAIVDFDGQIGDVTPGKYSKRLSTNNDEDPRLLRLTPSDKLVGMFRRDSVDGRQPRKDIFLVAFKTTAGASEDEMYAAGLKLCKEASANLVLVNDVVNRLNMVVRPATT